YLINASSKSRAPSIVACASFASPPYFRADVQPDSEWLFRVRLGVVHADVGLFRKTIHFLILGYRVLTRKESIPSSGEFLTVTIKQKTSTPSTTEIIAGVDKQRQRNPKRRGPGLRFEKGNIYAWKPGQS